MHAYLCPTCATMLRVQKRDEAPYRPFCCERCKLVDLGRWLDGTYRIAEPADPVGESAKDAAADDEH